MKNPLYILLLSLSLAFTNIVCFAQDKNNYILIINSYSYDNEWGTGISKAIRNSLETANKNLIVNTCYANIGNRSTYISDRFGMQGAFSSGRINKQIFIPSVLVLIGDESWMLYRMMNLRGLWDSVPVVICGVRPKIMSDYADFYSLHSFHDTLMMPVDKSLKTLRATGVAINDNEENTLKQIKALLPNLKHLSFLSHANYQDEYAIHNVRNIIDKDYPDITLNIINTKHTDKISLEKTLSELPKESAILTCNPQPDIKTSVPVFAINSYNAPADITGCCAYNIGELVSAASDAILRIHNGENPLSIPFSYLDGNIPYFDYQAIQRIGLETQAEAIPGITYFNTPPSLWNKYYTIIMIILIIIAVKTIIISIYIRVRKHGRIIKGIFDNYKKLYDEYIIISDNIPVGLFLFDNMGILQKRNKDSDNLLKAIYGKIPKNIFISEIKNLKSDNFVTIQKSITDEETKENNTLIIAIDNTEMQHAIKAKHQVFETLIFAMDASESGLAEYTLSGNIRFATDAWYKNLGIDKNTPIDKVYSNIDPDDMRKIELFKAQALKGEANLFMDTLRVSKNGTRHWIRHLIHILPYAKTDGEIVVAEVIFDMDEQKQREQDLSAALDKSRESYRMKNAFIANMKEEFMIPLGNLNMMVDSISECTDNETRKSLAASIEMDSYTILKLITEILEEAKSISASQKVS